MYSYSLTASAEALGLDNKDVAVCSGSSGEIVEVLAAELVTVLSGMLDEVELSVLLVVVELSVLLAEELSEVLTESELSGTVESSSLLEVDMLSTLLVDELSVLLDDVELSVLLVVEELSAVLELVELSEELVDELSEKSELSVSAEHAVIDTASTIAVKIAIKCFINLFPFLYFI